MSGQYEKMLCATGPRPLNLDLKWKHHIAELISLFTIHNGGCAVIWNSQATWNVTISYSILGSYSVYQSTEGKWSAIWPLKVVCYDGTAMFEDWLVHGELWTFTFNSCQFIRFLNIFNGYMHSLLFYNCIVSDANTCGYLCSVQQTYRYWQTMCGL